MSKQTVRYPFVVGLITLLLMLVIAQPLAAKDNSGKAEVEGTVSSKGHFCTQSDVPHPLGALLAERYEMKYEDLQAWFCDGHGWGQIMLALRTAKLTGADPAELLGERRSGEGWR